MFQLGTDAREEPDGYQEWYSTLKNDFTRKVMKAAAAEVDKKWLTWKADQIDRHAAAYEREIGSNLRTKGIFYLNETAERLGLQVILLGSPVEDIPIPTSGKKCTASGSTLRPAQPVPPPPALQVTRVNPPHAAKRTTFHSPALQRREPTPAPQPKTNMESPRGREATPAPQPSAHEDPSLTPRPRKKTAVPPTTRSADPEEALTASVLTKILA